MERDSRCLRPKYLQILRCMDYVCFHKFSGVLVEDEEELRGCIILIKAHRSERVVKFDADSQKVVVLRQYEVCNISNPTSHVHRLVEGYPPA